MDYDKGERHRMELNLLQIDELLNIPKNIIRRANEKDILMIKNELLMALNAKNEAFKRDHVRSLINDLQLLNVYVIKEEHNKTVFSYEPPKFEAQRVTIKESGWIEVNK